MDFLLAQANALRNPCQDMGSLSGSWDILAAQQLMRQDDAAARDQRLPPSASASSYLDRLHPAPSSSNADTSAFRGLASSKNSRGLLAAVSKDDLPRYSGPRAAPSLSGVSLSHSQSQSLAPALSGGHCEERFPPATRSHGRPPLSHVMTPKSELDLLQLHMLEELKVAPQPAASATNLHDLLIQHMGRTGSFQDPSLVACAQQRHGLRQAQDIAAALSAAHSNLGKRSRLATLQSEAAAPTLLEDPRFSAMMLRPAPGAPPPLRDTESHESGRHGTFGDEDKKLRRLAANREAARRMRKRQAERLAELEAQVAELTQTNGETVARLNAANARVAELERANASLEDTTKQLLAHFGSCSKVGNKKQALETAALQVICDKEQDCSLAQNDLGALPETEGTREDGEGLCVVGNGAEPNGKRARTEVAEVNPSATEVAEAAVAEGVDSECDGFDKTWMELYTECVGFLPDLY